MRSLFLIAFLLFSSCLTVSGQDPKDHNRQKCSDLIRTVSKGWKMDSLAGNGYRKTVYRDFLNCSIDGLTKLDVIQFLGAPNEKHYFYGGRVGFDYYYIDAKYIDTTKSTWLGI